MRTVIVSCLLAGLLISGIIACTSLDGTKKEESRIISPEMRAEIEQVGILHNQGLDSILIDLRKERIRLFKEAAAQPAAQNASSKQLFDMNSYMSVVYNTTKRVVKNWYPEAKDKDFETVMANPKIMKYTNANASLQSASGENEPNPLDMLTPFQKEYYNRLQTILNTEGMTIDRFKTEVLALEKLIEQNAPTVTEAEQLLYVTSIARHSAEYWMQNAAKWRTVLFSEIKAIHEKNKIIQHVPAVQATSKIDCGCDDLTYYYLDTVPDGTLLPDPNCLRIFIFVWNNTGICWECPDGLLFNPVLSVCDWPQNVNIWNFIDENQYYIGCAGLGMLGGAARGGGVGAVIGGLIGVAGCMWADINGR